MYLASQLIKPITLQQPITYTFVLLLAIATQYVQLRDWTFKRNTGVPNQNQHFLKIMRFFEYFRLQTLYLVKTLHTQFIFPYLIDSRYKTQFYFKKLPEICFLFDFKSVKNSTLLQKNHDNVIRDLLWVKNIKPPFSKRLEGFMTISCLRS